MVRLEIVTLEAKTFSDNVDSVVIPGVEGELGVLPMHAPMMTLLEPGELRVMKNGEETRLAVGEGFVEITQEKIEELPKGDIDYSTELPKSPDVHPKKLRDTIYYDLDPTKL